MKTPYSHYSFSPYFFEPLEDPYNPKELKEKKSAMTVHWDEDAIPDEAFAEAELQAKNSPSLKKRSPDDVENITLGIFANLCEVVDGKERREVKSAVTPLSSDSPTPLKKHHSHSSRFLQDSESNFSSDDFGSPINSQTVIQNIFHGIAEIFFGWDVFTIHPHAKTTEEMGDMVRKDKITWKTLCKQGHYSDYFQAQMQSIFKDADELLAERTKEEQATNSQRISFYAGFIIAAVGKLLGHTYLAAAGFATASIIFVFMASQYISSSFSQRPRELKLAATIAAAYHDAAKHRNLKIEDDL